MSDAPTSTKEKPGAAAKQGVGEGEKPHNIEGTLRKARMPELFQDINRANLVRVLFNDSQPRAFDSEELLAKLSDPSKVFPPLDDLVQEGFVVEALEVRGKGMAKTYRLAPTQYTLLARLHKADPNVISSLVEATAPPISESAAKVSKIVQDLVLMYMSKNSSVPFQELEEIICNPGLMDMRDLYLLLQGMEKRGLVTINDMHQYENGIPVIHITPSGNNNGMQLSQYEKEHGYPVTRAYSKAVIEAHAAGVMPWLL